METNTLSKIGNGVEYADERTWLDALRQQQYRDTGEHDMAVGFQWRYIGLN